jgi:hypothetical protein
MKKLKVGAGKAGKTKKRTSVSEIKEAIAYWRGRLASLNEAEEEDDDDEATDKDVGGDGDFGIPDGDKVEDKAKAAPVAVFNPLARFYRIHLRAERGVREKLAKLLHNKGLKGASTEDIQITNSAIDEGSGTFNADEETAVVTIKVTIDKAKLKGFRKFLAAVTESDLSEFERLDEASLLKSLFKGIADTAKGVGDAAKQKVADANEKLRQTIGVQAMQEYFKLLFGPTVAKKVTLKNVFSGADDEGAAGAQFVFCSAVTIKQ